MKEKFYMKEKSQKVSDGLSQIKVNLCDDVDVSPVKNHPSSYSDAKCREFIREHTPENCKLEVHARMTSV